MGTFLEVQTWSQYTEMLTQWASAIATFETTVQRISELPGLVYYEVEERHLVGEHVNVVNSLTVFEFDDDGKIRHLDVYLQQPALTEGRHLSAGRPVEAVGHLQQLGPKGVVVEAGHEGVADRATDGDLGHRRPHARLGGRRRRRSARGRPGPSAGGTARAWRAGGRRRDRA